MIFAHPRYKHFSNRYIVSSTGRVFRRNDGSELNYHRMCSGGKFVRLSGGKQRLLSMTVGKMVLIAFDPHGLRGNRIAIHLDGDVLNDYRDNLAWGSRADQTEVSMKKPWHRRRVYGMARKHHKTAAKERTIKRLLKRGYSHARIAREIGCCKLTVYLRAKSIGTKTKIKHGKNINDDNHARRQCRL